MPPLRVAVSSSVSLSVAEAEPRATVTSGFGSTSGSEKIQGRACLMASLLAAVILNSISMAKSSPSLTP